MRKIDVPEEYIEEYKKGKTLRQLSRDTGIDRGALKRAIQEHGIEIRQNSYRKDTSLKVDLFDSIDTQEKAYWAGFIAADGYSGFNKNKTSGTISISLHQKDKAHLEKAQKFFQTSRPIADIIVKDGFSSADGTPESRLVIYSKRLVEGLERIGIISPKSLFLKPPKIKPEFFGSFIAGFFDGDGTIFKINNEYTVGFTGTKEMLTWVATYVGHPDVTFSKRYTDNKNTYYIRWGGTNKPLKILNSFYLNSPYHLDRKYTLYLELQNVVQNRKISV